MRLSTHEAWAIGDLLLAEEPVVASTSRRGVGERRAGAAAKYGVSVRMAEVYRLVAHAWPPDTRRPDLSFSVHRILIGHPDRHKIIHLKNWTADAANAEVGRKV